VLPQLTCDAIHEHLKRRMAEGHAGAEWLFCDHKGGLLRRQNLARRSFKLLLVQADLPPIRFHDLRHTAATLLLIANVHPKVVSEMLGHAKVSITLDMYSHVLPTMQQESADKIDEMFAPKEDADDNEATA
jgi:integrase